jgi:hypothetical protein
MKIISRLSNDELQHERLRNIIEAATDGYISEGGELEPANDLEGLVTQVDLTCVSFLQEIDALERDNARLGNIAVSHQVALVKLREAFSNGVSYDEELDHATIDFMDAIMASGAAEATFDGEISFTTDLIMSKEDIKPILREAISSWVRLKIQ